MPLASLCLWHEALGIRTNQRPPIRQAACPLEPSRGKHNLAQHEPQGLVKVQLVILPNPVQSLAEEAQVEGVLEQRMQLVLAVGLELVRDGVVQEQQALERHLLAPSAENAEAPAQDATARMTGTCNNSSLSPPTLATPVANDARLRFWRLAERRVPPDSSIFLFSER